MYKRFLNAFIVVLLVGFVLIGSVFAADGEVVITDSGITFSPGTDYSNTSLFPGFKNVMPGDKIEQSLKVTNNVSNYDYVRVYITGIPHSDSDNPLYDGLTSKTPEGETVEFNDEFLSAFTLKVYAPATSTEPVYSGTPKLSPGTVEVGKLNKNQSYDIKVVLEADIEKLNNNYANKFGVFDWVFTAEKYNDPSISIETSVVGSKDAFRPGEDFEYIIKVTNGNEQVKDVVITDTLNNIEIHLGEDVILEPGQVIYVGVNSSGEAQENIPYTVTQDDVDKGTVTNTATVTAKSVDDDYTNPDYVDPQTGLPTNHLEASDSFTVNAVPIPTYTVTVNYLSTTGATLYPSSVQTLTEGSQYNASGLINLAIPGYTRTGVEGTVAGILSGNVVINVRYAIVEEDDPPYTPPTTPVYYTITVRYVDHEGKVLLPSSRTTVQAGTAYDVTYLTDVSIKGYTLYGVIGEVTGTANGNILITVRYDPIPVEPVIIDPPEPPLGGPAWALLNLICTILTCIIGLCMIISYFKKKEEDDEVEKLEKALEKAKAAYEKAVASGDQVQILRTLAVVQRITKELEEAKRRALIIAQNKAKDEGRRPPETYEEIEEEDERKKSKFFGIIPAVAAVITFILTEDMRLPMVWKDRWTLLMIIILLVNAVLAYLTRNKKEEEDDEDHDEDKKKQNAAPSQAV